jgi:hypothetical protein
MVSAGAPPPDCDTFPMPDPASLPRLLYLCQEFPFPVNHGGRVDTYRRLRALADRGVPMCLVGWAEWAGQGRPGPYATELDALSTDWHVLPYARSAGQRLRQLRRVFDRPALVLTRELDAQRYGTLAAAARAFRPDVVFVDAVFAADLGRRLAIELGVPWVLRSHNREYDYFRRQLAVESTWRGWLRTRARLSGLRGFEQGAFAGAARVFDISADDLAAWRTEGLRNGVWLPPLRSPGRDAPAPAPAEPAWDLGFVGNLYMANNVAGVTWLVDAVLPAVRAVRPATTLVIAGSRPTPALRAALEGRPGVTLLPDVDDPDAVLAACRVLLNPTATGSGVAMKAIDMLMSERPIVTTSQGVQGLPDDVRRCFLVADGAEPFAARVLEALGAPHVDREARAAARRHFGPEAIDRLLAELVTVVDEAGGATVRRKAA